MILILLGIFLICVCIVAKRKAGIEFSVKYDGVIENFGAWMDQLEDNRGGKMRASRRGFGLKNGGGKGVGRSGGGGRNRNTGGCAVGGPGNGQGGGQGKGKNRKG